MAILQRPINCRLYMCGCVHLHPGLVGAWVWWFEVHLVDCLYGDVNRPTRHLKVKSPRTPFVQLSLHLFTLLPTKILNKMTLFYLACN
ncbi:hypothetical protein L1987_14847 [Smallanthus sonchifolius]|uniref:Uncharacterized protein n=1 Tax=Smallanthus sonchifolius TaxID=185202 RepID=A0ACB9J5H8_9ASTR|nr:hypothetical protein L1987_14847 [Smallanthus sonchifolius]